MKRLRSNPECPECGRLIPIEDIQERIDQGFGHATILSVGDIKYLSYQLHIKCMCTRIVGVKEDIKGNFAAFSLDK